MSHPVAQGAYRAVVADTSDPEGRGRVRTRIPALLGAALSAWALPCIPAGGGLRLPALGASTWVIFENGEVEHPVYFGTWVFDGSSAGGSDGLSAYDLAVQQGFVGTLDEWLASLVGPPGPAGDPGGYKRYVDLGNPPAVAGVAQTSADLHTIYAIMAATSAGSSSAAALGLVRRLTGRSDGTSTATAGAQLALSLAGSSAGTSTAAAAPSAVLSLAASSAGSSTASGSLGETLVLTATSADGTGSSSAALVLSRGATATSAGSSTASGDLAVASSSSPTPAPFGSQMFGS